MSTTRDAVCFVAGVALVLTARQWRAADASSSSRFAFVVVLLAGAVVNAFIAKLLKLALRVRRPDGAALSDPGFPSSHAMSLFFFASCLSASARRSSIIAIAAFAPSALYAAAALLSMARVRAGLHSVSQVTGGAVFGAIVGRLWRSAAVGDALPWAIASVEWSAGAAAAATATPGLIVRLDDYLAALAAKLGSELLAVALPLALVAAIGLFAVSNTSRELFFGANASKESPRRRPAP